MVLYFTGTGNSEFCAKYISEKTNDECLNLFEKVRNSDYSEIQSQRPFVIVCPTYAWRIPRLINDFLLKTPLKGNENIYFVMTCGGEIGYASKYIQRLCGEKGMHYKGVFSVKMPDNYIAMFNIGSNEENKEVIKNSIPELTKISEIIQKEEYAPQNKITLQDKALSGFINTAFYSLFVKDKDFTVTNDCIGCGLCEKNCPLGNITMVNNKPHWNGNCTHCMACISHCPKKAIEYGNKSKGKNRYTFPKKDF